MLTLKRVEIQGFKSFFDKSEMRFNGSGIAAIVGPNGCGKSNLSDAISWVLGEQSVKTLRGSRMEDVIFAGTRDRKPLGMASVTMTLVDPRLHAPNGSQNGAANGSASHSAHPAEITITRRLFRSGESEYLINGKAARLRDIQDLFLGTGLGPESYAIIEQGRIGQILSNKPQDRRAVIEEAAGITKFKTKKRLAEAKLEGAKQNLARVFDILEEVARQVNSLKRQSAKAKRYGELKTEMVEQLRNALTGRFQILEREAARTALDLNAAASAYLTLSGQVVSGEREYKSSQEQCYSVEAELTEARRQVSELRLERERARGKLESQAGRISAIEQRLSQSEAETQDLQARQERHEGELRDHLAAVAEIEFAAASARDKLTAKTSEREQLNHDLQNSARTLESGRQQVLRLLGEASTLKNLLAQIDEYLAGVDRDTARAAREEQTALADRDRLETLQAGLALKIAAREAELQSTAEEKQGVEVDLAARKDRAAEARRDFEQLRSEAAQLHARRDSLERIVSHRSYTTGSVQRLFTAVEKDQTRDFQPLGVLADFIEVDPDYEKTAEEFLHEELEHVVVKDWSQAERGIELLRSELDGRATFLVEDEFEAAPAPNSAPPLQAPGIVGRLSDHVRFTNGLTQAPAALIPKLANCYLTEDRAAAQRLSVSHPDAYFLLPDGISYHGRALSGGKKQAGGPLALKRELREVSRQLGAKEKALQQTARLVDDLDREIAQLAGDLDRLRSAQQTHEKDALALDHESRKLAEEFSRASSRMSLARLELDRASQERRRAHEQRDQNLRLFDEKEAARDVQEQVLQQSRADFDEMQAEAARIGEEHAALRAALAAFEERLRAEKAAQARLESLLREIAARRRNVTAEMERLGVDRAHLLSDNIELDQRAGTLLEQIAQFDRAVADLAGREAESRSRLAFIEQNVAALRAAAQAAHENRSQIELTLVKLQAELKYLDETSRKELNVAVQELARPEENLLDSAGVEEAERRCQELRAKIDALGPVNPTAWEEFQEAQQRYDFLNAQRQDLLDSIRDTEKAIHEIDNESRKRFADAFEAINANFRETFKTLFGGGISEMRLTDEANIAESGIDIIASPPGKKLQSVLLLSGGEKALTAMALLMAVFQYQPSPFCILDEIDAPLDDPNIERLTRLLRDMSSQTQFIVITHAKRTMEAAQSLYGVTMQEPGISKLVSVRFEPLGGSSPRLPTHSETLLQEAGSSLAGKTIPVRTTYG